MASFMDRNLSTVMESAGKVADLMGAIRKMRWDFALEKAKMEYGTRQRMNEHKWEEKVLGLKQKYDSEESKRRDERMAGIEEEQMLLSFGYEERIKNTEHSNRMKEQFDKQVFDSEEAKKRRFHEIVLRDIENDYDWKKFKAIREHEIDMQTRTFKNEREQDLFNKAFELHLTKITNEAQRKTMALEQYLEDESFDYRFTKQRQIQLEDREYKRDIQLEDRKYNILQKHSNNILNLSSQLNEIGIDVKSATEQALRRLDRMEKEHKNLSFDDIGDAYNAFYSRVRGQLSEREQRKLEAKGVLPPKGYISAGLAADIAIEKGNKVLANRFLSMNPNNLVSLDAVKSTPDITSIKTRTAGELAAIEARTLGKMAMTEYKNKQELSNSITRSNAVVKAAEAIKALEEFKSFAIKVKGVQYAVRERIKKINKAAEEYAKNPNESNRGELISKIWDGIKLSKTPVSGVNPQSGRTEDEALNAIRDKY